jgi:hypothetical protein
VRTWEANDPDFGRPIAAPLDQCAELLGVDLVTIQELAADVEPYLRADGTTVWSLMQLWLVGDRQGSRSPSPSHTHTHTYSRPVEPHLADLELPGFAS